MSLASSVPRIHARQGFALRRAITELRIPGLSAGGGRYAASSARPRGLCGSRGTHPAGNPLRPDRTDRITRSHQSGRTVVPAGRVPKTMAVRTAAKTVAPSSRLATAPSTLVPRVVGTPVATQDDDPLTRTWLRTMAPDAASGKVCERRRAGPVPGGSLAAKTRRARTSPRRFRGRRSSPRPRPGERLPLRFASRTVTLR